MKTLRKTLVLVSIIGVFFSCTSDRIDGGNDIKIQTLLGAWQLTASSQNGVDTKLSKCDLSDLIIFDESKLMYVYNKNNSGDHCSIITLKKDFTLRENIITQEDGTEVTILQIYNTAPSSLILEFEDTYNDDIIVYRETYTKRQ